MASYPHPQSNEQSIIPLRSNRLAQEQKYNSRDDDREHIQQDDGISRQGLLTIPQVAQQLNICRAHVYTLMKQGLPTIHLGRSVRVSAVALQNWLQDREGNL